MPRVVILHGYSDNYTSFTNLRDFLGRNGFQVTDISIGDYISLEDRITIQDLAKAFRAALAKQSIPTAAQSFDLIVHSTGALVAREWLARYFLERNAPCPVRRFLMLAPANFGSPLAHLGRTMFGRIVKGWNSNFQTGCQVLDALEMGSRYTWDLAHRDLFGPASFFKPDTCLTAVFVGTHPYEGGFRELVNKPGGDGTVYVSTANLNATALALHFTADARPPTVTSKPRAAAPIAFRVFNDRDHASITRPDTGPPSLGREIVTFLQTTPATYGAFFQYCKEQTELTLPPNPTDDIYHSYQNVVFRVSDDLGMPVKDYYMEFYEANIPADEHPDVLMVKIHTGVIEDVHTYQNDNSLRSFIFDITDMDAALENHTLAFSLSAAGPSSIISYTGTTEQNIGQLVLPNGSDALALFRRPNETLFVDIVVDRLQDPKVFSLH
jgi:pimeloyl-ACP methyl ester carboxylesterase